MYRNFRDSAITLLAIGTAFGLGVITTVACEIKLAIEARKIKKEQESED